MSRGKDHMEKTWANRSLRYAAYKQFIWWVFKGLVKEIEEWSHLVPYGGSESYTRNLIESTPYIQKGEDTNLWYYIVAFAFALWKLIDKNIKILKASNIQFVFSNLYTINHIRKNIKSFCSSVSKTWHLILNDHRLF